MEPAGDSLRPSRLLGKMDSQQEKEECGKRIGLQRLFPKLGRLEP